MTLEVSVVIPTSYRAHWLEKSLISLGTQDLAPESFEIIVADYGDPQPTREAVARVRSSKPSLQIRHLEIEGEGHAYRALTRARNTGIRAAQGRLVAQLPPECLLSPTALRLCVDVHNSGSEDLLTTVTPWYVSEKATQHIERADWKSDALNVCRTFGEEEVRQPDGSKPWSEMHFPIVKRKWAAWMCGFNERFQSWGYESVDFVERLATYAAEHTEIVDDRVALFHLWHPVGNDHGDIRTAIIEKILNGFPRQVLVRTMRAMELLPRDQGLGPNYEQMRELLSNLPNQSLNGITLKATREFESSALPQLEKQKASHRPGSETLGTHLWPGLQRAVQWGDYASAMAWMDDLLREYPDDPAPMAEKAKMEALLQKREARPVHPTPPAAVDQPAV